MSHNRGGGYFTERLVCPFFFPGVGIQRIDEAVFRPKKDGQALGKRNGGRHLAARGELPELGAVGGIKGVNILVIRSHVQDAQVAQRGG